MKALGEAWAPIIAQFTDDERAVFEASAARQAALVAARQAWRPGAGPLPQNRPADWALDGSERRYDGTPGYACWTCRDSGWVRRDVPLGDPAFGQAQRCDCQGGAAATRAALIRQRRAASFLPPAYDAKALGTFVPVPGTEEAYAAAEGWWGAWERTGTPGWLVLWGAPGCGKSHLLAALGNVVLLTSALLWVDVPWWLEQMAAGQFAHADEWKRSAHQAPVLVLDECGSQATPEWGRQWLETLIVERYGRNQPTLFGMTCLPHELAAWSARIHDRLRDRALVRHGEMTAGSYRPRLEARG